MVVYIKFITGIKMRNDGLGVGHAACIREIEIKWI
jgi:hypothetical protein